MVCVGVDGGVGVGVGVGVCGIGKKAQLLLTLYPQAVWGVF